MPKSTLLSYLFPALHTFNFGDGDVAGETPPAKPATPEMFTKEYVHELRTESASNRVARQEAERKLTAAEEAKTLAETSANEKITAATTAANERILRAELKASALKAGMVDLDGLKLADLSKVKLNDAGEVEGAETLMEELKKAKPYLFGSTTTTSNEVKPPARKDNEPKKATDMTKEEYAAERQKIARGIFPTVV